MTILIYLIPLLLLKYPMCRTQNFWKSLTFSLFAIILLFLSYELYYSINPETAKYYVGDDTIYDYLTYFPSTSSVGFNISNYQEKIFLQSHCVYFQNNLNKMKFNLLYNIIKDDCIVIENSNQYVVTKPSQHMFSNVTDSTDSIIFLGSFHLPYSKIINNNNLNIVSTNNNKRIKNIHFVKCNNNKFNNNKLLKAIINNSIIKMVLFESCFQYSSQQVSIQNIYHYYDNLINTIQEIHQVCGHCLVVWMPPPTYLFSDGSQDIWRLHEFIIIKYVITMNRVLVMPAVWKNTTSVGYHKGKVQRLQRRNSAVEKSLSDGAEAVAQVMLTQLAQQLNYIRDRWSERDEQGAFKLGAARSYDHDWFRSTAKSSSAAPLSHLHQSCQRYLLSRRYAAACMPRSTVLLPVLVTGLGGSGTHAATNALRAAGVAVAHERLAKDGSVCWFYAVNDQVGRRGDYPHRAALPSKSLLSPRFERVWHLVRRPLPHVSSFSTHLPASYAFVQTHARLNISLPHSCHRRGHRCHLRLAAHSYIHWNALISSYADERFPVEQTDKLVHSVCRFLEQQPGGHPRCSRYLRGDPAPLDGPSAKGSTAHSTHPAYSVQDIEALEDGSELAKALFQMAQEYGY